MILYIYTSNDIAKYEKIIGHVPESFILKSKVVTNGITKRDKSSPALPERIYMHYTLYFFKIDFGVLKLF